MQELSVIRPSYVSTDPDELKTPPDAGKFIKGLKFGGGKNGNLPTGTGSSSPGGENFKVQAACPSNIAACKIPFPEGTNKCIGAYEAVELNKIFYLNHNSNSKHALYMIDGDTLQCQKVVVTPDFKFSLDPAFNIPAHKVHVRVYYAANPDGGKRVKEMHFIYTDSNEWQKWINVLAGIRSDGFNATLYPYWTVHAPHFDTQELIDYPTRPPMFCPTFKDLPLDGNDIGKKNPHLNKSVQLAYAFLMTDGRFTTFSPYSLPFYHRQNTCNINNTNLTRCLEFTLYAGSPLVEKIYIFRRFCGGTWSLYEIIDRFTSCGDNDPVLIGDEYWKRVGSWAGYNYDSVTNTIKYKYCGDQECAIINQEDANRFQTDIPITSVCMTPAGDNILLANNKYFYDPLSCDTLKSIRILVNQPPASGACNVKNVKITLYSFMGRDGFQSCFAYTKGDDKMVRFGGVSINSNNNLEIDESDSNVFNLNYADNKGQVCFFRGTPYYAIGKQYKVDKAGVKTLVGIIDIGIQSQKDYAADILRNGGIFLWQYDFIVPAGKYIASLAAHDCNLAADYQSTSSPVFGISNSQNKPAHLSQLTLSALVSDRKEMEIDACAGDVDIFHNGKDVFHVFVPYQYSAGGVNRWRYITGNVREEKDSKIGVELLLNEPTNGEDQYKRSGKYTDHNGFYFAYTARGAARESNVSFRGKFNCILNNDEKFRTSGLPSDSSGYFPNTNVIVADVNGGAFGKCNRILVRGKITDCDGGAGLSGVAVTITRGGTTYTTSDGTFELVVHNSYEGIRNDKIYFNASGACIFAGCNCECTPIIFYSDASVPCVSCVERIYPTAVSQTLRVVVSNQRTLKGGGRYGVGVIGYDLAGRATLINHIQYIDIPTFMERGNFLPVSLQWELLGNLNLPPHIKYVSFFRTNNLNFESHLQWVGDKIEFLDTKGDVVNSASGAVRARVTIQSLNDFNVANRFSSLTKYQFVSGDILRVMDDGDGNMFNPANTNGLMDYQILGTNWNDLPPTGIAGDNPPITDGKSFIIPFDKRLEGLKDKCGFWIEIMRPKECKDKEPYCEICGMYPVIDGEIIGGQKKGDLNTWDTYYQSRFFKVNDCAGKAFIHPFESSSITDFWGENCGSCGRISIKDDTVVQRWYPDDIIKSDNYINEGGYNGLGTFREKNRKKLTGQEWGGIVAIHAERNIIFLICQNDWHILDFNFNVARVTNEGLIVANLPESLSDSNQKVGNNYGCMYEHTAAVIFHDGVALWPDGANRSWILSDYQTAVEISAIDNKFYFQDKFKHILDHNKSLSPEDYLPNLYEVCAGVDRGQSELHVTFRPRRDHSENVDAFFNDLREVKMNYQETFVFNLEQKKWTRWAHFTPEFYCSLHNIKNGSDMITFVNGQPYYHNSKDAVGFNNYYGIQGEMVLEGVIINDEDKEKVDQSVVINSNDMMFYVDRMYTNEQNSLSYIPPAYMKKKGNIWYSEILADMNSYPNPDPTFAYRAMLIDGKAIRGKFVRCRLVSDPERNGEYAEVNGFMIRTMASEKSGKK